MLSRLINILNTLLLLRLHPFVDLLHRHILFILILILISRHCLRIVHNRLLVKHKRLPMAVQKRLVDSLTMILELLAQIDVQYVLLYYIFIPHDQIVATPLLILMIFNCEIVNVAY